MMRKYIVPKQFRHLFGENEVVYCKVTSIVDENTDFVYPLYLVKMINYKNKTDVFMANELKKLNLVDRIKVLKYRRNK